MAVSSSAQRSCTNHLDTSLIDWPTCLLPAGTKKMFASSFHTGSTPFKFKLGSSEVVDGWNRGLLGMCEGASAWLGLGLGLA
jgi:hypothetical protein